MIGRSKKSTRDPNRKFDKTQCRRGRYEHTVHRDYIAHCFRWGWATRLIEKHGKSVLDVGCGQDLPLPRLLGTTNNFPGRYVGVDYNPLPTKPNWKWIEAIHDDFDFTTRYTELGEPFDVVVCFEVIEHMHVEDGLKLLEGIKHNLTPEGQALLSTPVFNGRLGENGEQDGAAANHLHEWTISELQSAIESVGLVVEGRWGTFASYNDLKRVMTPEHRAVDDAVRQFYGNDILSCFLSPLYPDASRNNAWILRKA